MKIINKTLSILTLTAILGLAFATPAMAFDGRSGDTVTIAAGEVINDDLYVTAETFNLEGTIEGDLVVIGSVITINGTVNGDVFALGQSVVINGTITGDVRIAGAALQLGKTASLGEDLLAGGASLETKDGSTIGGELVFGSGQSLLAGDVTGNVLAGAGALELSGQFGGDVNVDVGDAGQGNAGSFSNYMPNTSVTVPSVASGLTIADSAKIEGNLVYTHSEDINIPAGSVGGKITRNQPVVDTQNAYVPPTPAEMAISWVFDLLRTMVTLLVFGLILGWLVPAFIRTLMDKVQTKPLASLGWGVIAYAAFIFIILVILVALVVGGIVFGVLTLGGISSSIVVIGLLSIAALTVAFALVTAFLTKIVIARLSGRLILNRFNPALADHKVWPLVLGVVIVALAISLPWLGWLFSIVITLLGLGALWTSGRDAWQTRKTA